jgi:cell division initiation protein
LPVTRRCRRSGRFSTPSNTREQDDTVFTMPLKPEELDSTKLPVAFRGYDRPAIDDLLERVALDYRQAARESEWSKARIAELEARAAADEAEGQRLRDAVGEHEERKALIEAMLLTAQRTADEIRDAAQQEADEMLRAAREQAVNIERDARLSIRRTTEELDRLRGLESDLRTRLRQTLETALGEQ